MGSYRRQETVFIVYGSGHPPNPEMRIPGLVGTLTTLAVACASTTSATTGAPDAFVVGSFTDDYNATHTVTATEWRHGSRARYHIVKWNTTGQYLIARNDSANPGDGGLWTRIDWMKLDGMVPWTWGYCMSAFKAPSADSAESTRVANRATARTGCNGFPFTRMKATAQTGPR
jgi:hypothetical protein